LDSPVCLLVQTGSSKASPPDASLRVAPLAAFAGVVHVALVMPAMLPSWKAGTGTTAPCTGIAHVDTFARAMSKVAGAGVE
jgi:hypothetical protein